MVGASLQRQLPVFRASATRKFRLGMRVRTVRRRYQNRWPTMPTGYGPRITPSLRNYAGPAPHSGRIAVAKSPSDHQTPRKSRSWEMRWGCPRRRSRVLAVNPAYFRDRRLTGASVFDVLFPLLRHTFSSRCLRRASSTSSTRCSSARPEVLHIVEPLAHQGDCQREHGGVHDDRHADC